MFIQDRHFNNYNIAVIWMVVHIGGWHKERPKLFLPF